MNYYRIGGGFRGLTDMMYSASDSEYLRSHIVRVCREKCVDAGYSGDAYLRCVSECVKELTSTN